MSIPLEMSVCPVDLVFAVMNRPHKYPELVESKKKHHLVGSLEPVEIVASSVVIVAQASSSHRPT